MADKAKPDDKPAEYEKFDEAMKKLIRVPKRELDEAVKEAEKERRKK